jgi:hypothetical protein
VLQPTLTKESLFNSVTAAVRGTVRTAGVKKAEKEKVEWWRKQPPQHLVEEGRFPTSYVIST